MMVRPRNGRVNFGTYAVCKQDHTHANNTSMLGPGSYDAEHRELCCRVRVRVRVMGYFCFFWAGLGVGLGPRDGQGWAGRDRQGWTELNG